MKQFYLFFLFVVLAVLECHAQPKSSAEADTLNVFVELSKKAGMEGKKLSVLSDYFKSHKVQIRFFSFDGTSPYIDSKGLSYLERVQVGYLTADELDNRVSNEHLWAMLLDITLEPPYNVATKSLLQRYPLGDEQIDAGKRFAMIQDMFTIKSIKCWYIAPIDVDYQKKNP